MMSDGRQARIDRAWGAAAAAVGFVVVLGLLLVSCGDSEDPASLSAQGEADQSSEGGGEADTDEPDYEEEQSFEGTLSGGLDSRSITLERGDALRVSLEPLDYRLVSPQLYLTVLDGDLREALPSSGLDGYDGLGDVLAGVVGSEYDVPNLFSDYGYGGNLDSLPPECADWATLDGAVGLIGFPVATSDQERIPSELQEGDFASAPPVLSIGGSSNSGHTPVWVSFVAPADGEYNVVIAGNGVCGRYADDEGYVVRIQRQASPLEEAEDSAPPVDEFDQGGLDQPAQTFAISTPEEQLSLIEYHWDFLNGADFFPTDMLYSDLYSDGYGVESWYELEGPVPLPEETNPDAGGWYGPPALQP